MSRKTIGAYLRYASKTDDKQNLGLKGLILGDLEEKTSDRAKIKSGQLNG